MNRTKNMTISLMDLPGQYKYIEEEVLPEIKKVLASGLYVQGPKITEFEENFAKYCGAKYCIGVSSGTDALIFALKALNIGIGDEVITVPNTFTATAEAIVLVGARPVFCDIDPNTQNMDPESLEKRLTKRTRAVIPVHLHGNPADLDKIYRICKRKKIAIIEDAAQAHGSIYKGKKIGSHKSDFVCFSFHPVKNLGAFGDAGAIVTNNKKLAELVRKLINHGREEHHRHTLIGTTGRLDTIQAAILDIKLKKLDNWIKSKINLVEYYKEKLNGICKFIDTTPKSESAYHVLAILTTERDELAKFLEKYGIETGMHYPIPLYLQTAYKSLGYKKGDFPNAEKYASQTLTLPLFPHMKKSQIDYIVDKIKKFNEK
ncbi:MAG: DegT/DnrJ/EryC1/StrS family aminotransferase [Candidatus Daviesbacteria bacterium]|nr:DegT/DnrJ/EryC1/StrS family aminotransferase [Candidatus Daviesbacteria bacterium]